MTLPRNPLRWTRATLGLAGAFLLPFALHAQELSVPKPRPVPPLPRPDVPVPDPTEPAARTVTDSRTHVSLHLPAGWTLSRQDGELSTFRMDARSAPSRTQLRLVASLAFNPFPRSTFAGALVYLSVTPHSSPAECSAQALGKPNTGKGMVRIGGVPFSQGRDEHGVICTEERDDVYTTLRNGSCLRFDLAINTFCGGEVSAATDMSDRQLANIAERLHGILLGVSFAQ